MPNFANNLDSASWLHVDSHSDFPIQNIPFGVFLTKDHITTISSRIGDTAIDLAALHQLEYFKGIPLTDDIFLQDTLNDFIAGENCISWSCHKTITRTLIQSIFWFKHWIYLI